MNKIFIAILLMSFMTINVFSQDNSDFQIRVVDGSITILRYTGTEIGITIPPVIENIPVKAINDRAFLGKKITSIQLPSGLEYIGSEAFRGNKLKTLDIPDTVTFIGSNCFSHNEITSINFPKSSNFIFIADYSFTGNKITALDLPENIEYIGKMAFANNSITNIILPHVLFIGVRAFEGNPYRVIELSEKLQFISTGAFNSSNARSPYEIEIKIGNNVEIGNEPQDGKSISAFPTGFERDYSNNGKRSGTYIYIDRNWVIKQ